MEEMDKLLKTIDTLLGPEGCPWDRDQTLKSLRSALLEESCELIEAIDLNDDEKINEELGDFIFMGLFLARVAEKEAKSALKQAVNGINEKLIRRHPHVFSDSATLHSASEVKEQWDRIKAQEKEHKSLLDRIPKGLPALARADELLHAMKKKKYPLEINESKISEEQIGQALFALVQQAFTSNVEAEQALRKILSHEEKKFRQWELEQE